MCMQRAKRKEAQCESFSLILQLMGIPEVSDYLEQPPCIVEFGCGSGKTKSKERHKEEEGLEESLDLM